MMTERDMTNRIEIYCEPKIKRFLTDSWLHMGFWERLLSLPYVLEQLGMAGNITAYGDTDVLDNFSFDDYEASNTDNEFAIFFVNSPKKVTTLKFFREGDKATTSCCIPGYDREYTRDFAIVKEKEGVKTYSFYDLCDLDWSVFPRFNKEFHENGIICMETTEAEYIRVTFAVDKSPNCTLKLTIVIRNDDNPKLVIDSYKKNILKVLYTEKAKSLYTQYEMIRKFIGHITSDYVFSCNTGDGNITDELVITDGKTEKFMLTFGGKSYTLFKSNNWVTKDNTQNITIKCKNNMFSFPETEFSTSELNYIKEVVDNDDSFIRENMVFAFKD